MKIGDRGLPSELSNLCAEVNSSLPAEMDIDLVLQEYRLDTEFCQQSSGLRQGALIGEEQPKEGALPAELYQQGL